MKRLAAILLLAACSDSEPDPPCPSQLISDVVHWPGEILPGPHVAGITWHVQIGSQNAEDHGAMLMPDGTVGPDISLPEPVSNAATGKTSVFWYGTTQPPNVSRKAALQRGAELVHFELPPQMQVVFDGTSYQLFWLENGLSHRSLSETGELGPVHAIAYSGAQSFSVATDGAGQVFVRLAEDGFLFDTTTGAMQRIYDAPADSLEQLGVAFYFNGAYYMIDERPATNVVSVTVTGVRRLLEWPDGLTDVVAVVRRGDHMLVQSRHAVLELDATHAIAQVVNQSPAPGGVGIVGGRVVRFDRTELDETTREPGRLAIVGETWRRELAVDSLVRLAELCGDIAF